MRFAPALNNEINVTPMIDVLLVLLIIFMAAIPSMRKSIDVQVPDPRPAPPGPGTPSIVLEIAANGAYAINRSPVAHDALAARIHEIYDHRPGESPLREGRRTPAIRGRRPGDGRGERRGSEGAGTTAVMRDVGRLREASL
jgi:hypothetical protein